jgi:hypothetical protein
MLVPSSWRRLLMDGGKLALRLRSVRCRDDRPHQRRACPGQSRSVTITGTYTPPPNRPQEVGAELDSNGGNRRVVMPCLSGG